jgi:hypothetical protein
MPSEIWYKEASAFALALLVAAAAVADKIGEDVDENVSEAVTDVVPYWSLYEAWVLAGNTLLVPAQNCVAPAHK